MSMRHFLPALAILAAVGLAAAGTGSEIVAPDTAGIPDREIGLSPGSVFEVPVPPAVEDALPEPGESTPLARVYQGAPPLITHLVADFLPITRQENLCIDCHLVDEAGEGEPTPVPASHRTDLRNAPGKVGGKVVGARYNCVTCHVPATGAKLLVGNGFWAGSPGE